MSFTRVDSNDQLGNIGYMPVSYDYSNYRYVDAARERRISKKSRKFWNQIKPYLEHALKKKLGKIRAQRYICRQLHAKT